MQLVDATYYKNDFKGLCIPVSAFDYYYRKSISRLNYYTFDRLKDIDMSNYQFSNDIKNCICEISELLFKQEIIRLFNLKPLESIQQLIILLVLVKKFYLMMNWKQDVTKYVR